MNIKNKINNMDDAKREKLGEVIRFGIVGGRSRIHPLPHRQLLDADPLSQPLRRLGSCQTAGYDTYPLHLHPGKLPSGEILSEEIRNPQNTIKERYEKDIRYF